MSPADISDNISILTISPCKLFDYTLDPMISPETTFVESDSHIKVPILHLNFEALLATAQQIDEGPYSHWEKILLAQLQAQSNTIHALQWRSDFHVNFLNQEIDALDADKARLVMDIRALEHEHVAEHGRVVYLETALAELEGQHRVLRDAYDRGEDRIRKLTERVAMLEEERCDVTAAREAVKIRVSALDSQLSALHAEHNELGLAHKAAASARAEKASLDAEVVRLTTDLEMSKGALLASDEHLQALCAEHSELQSEHRNLSAKLEAQATSLLAAEAQAKLLETEITAQTELYATACSAISDLQTRHDDLAAELKQQAAASAVAYPRIEELEAQLQDQIDSRLIAAELEKELKAEAQMQRDVAAAAERRVDQLKATLTSHELTTGVALASAEARVAELEKELDAERESAASALVAMKSRIAELERAIPDKDRVIEHITMQSTAVIKYDAELKREYATVQRLLDMSKSETAQTREELQKVAVNLQNALTDRDALTAELRSQQSLTIHLDAELTTTTNRLNAVIAEKEMLVKLAEVRDAELSSSQDVNVTLGCRIADLEEQLVQAYADSERSVEKINVEVEEERARRNDFQEVAQVTLEAILNEKDKLRDMNSAMEKQLARVRASAGELQAKYDDITKENVELQLALKTIPAASELHQAKQLVARYAQQIANCDICSRKSTA